MPYPSAMPAYSPALDRFRAKVEVSRSLYFQGTPCYLWTGTCVGKGTNWPYGQFWLSVRDEGGGKFVLAHRWSYEQAFGPIPDGLVIDHLCRRTRCVNPLHLEVVPQLVNSQRQVISEAERALRSARFVELGKAKAKDNCKCGLPYDRFYEVVLKSGSRSINKSCSACRKAASQRFNAKGTTWKKP